MSNFIKNLNRYIDHYGLKKAFIIEHTGIEKNKFSRLLHNKQDIKLEDMEKIAKALDKEISFFMQDDLQLESTEYKESTSIAFYLGKPDKNKVELANKAFDFLEHLDAIFSIRKTLKKDAYEVLDYEI